VMFVCCNRRCRAQEQRHEGSAPCLEASGGHVCLLVVRLGRKG
jgi:hypothetical protein